MDKYEHVYHRDGYRCVYCGKYLLADFDSWQSIHTDHLVPVAAGGGDQVENWVTSCAVCNMLKGKFSPSEHFKPENRDEYIQANRHYIHQRRAEKMPRFFRLIDQINKRFLPAGTE